MLTQLPDFELFKTTWHLRLSVWVWHSWWPVYSSIPRFLQWRTARCQSPINQRWTDSLLLGFMIHLDSQADCDDSIQLNSYFLGAQKRLDSWFQIMLAIESTIQVWFFQSYGKLERIQLNSIHSWDWMQNAANVHPFAHLPHLLPTYLANQLQSSQLFDVAGFKELHWFSLRWIKIDHSPVSLSSLYHWGDNLKGYLYLVNNDPNLVIF